MVTVLSTARGKVEMIHQEFQLESEHIKIHMTMKTDTSQDRPIAKLQVSILFTSWVFQLTRAVAHWLCTTRLLLCMDVETNPGPDDNPSFLHVLDWRFGQMMQGLHTFTTNITRMIEDKWEKLDKKIQYFSAEMKQTRQHAEENRQDIRDLQEDGELISSRLEKLERKLESIEVESKQCNLKFVGVEEIHRGDSYTDAEMIVDLLNDYSSAQNWQLDDISRAYRVGNPRQRNGQPRPLIVQFSTWRNKMAVLTDHSLSNELRYEGIKVTSDLTTRQRDTIDFYRSQGKIAFYHSGRLQFAQRQPPLSQQPYQGDYHNRYREDQHEDTARVSNHNNSGPFLNDEEWPKMQHRRQKPAETWENWDRRYKSNKLVHRQPDHRMNDDCRRDDNDRCTERDDRGQGRYMQYRDTSPRRRRRAVEQRGKSPDANSNYGYRYTDDDNSGAYHRNSEHHRRETYVSNTSRGVQDDDFTGRQARSRDSRHTNSNSAGTGKSYKPLVPGDRTYSEVVRSRSLSLSSLRENRDSNKCCSRKTDSQEQASKSRKSPHKPMRIQYTADNHLRTVCMDSDGDDTGEITANNDLDVPPKDRETPNTDVHNNLNEAREEIQQHSSPVQEDEQAENTGDDNQDNQELHQGEEDHPQDDAKSTVSAEGNDHTDTAKSQETVAGAGAADVTRDDKTSRSARIDQARRTVRKLRDRHNSKERSSSQSSITDSFSRVRTGAHGKEGRQPLTRSASVSNNSK